MRDLQEVITRYASVHPAKKNRQALSKTSSTNLFTRKIMNVIVDKMHARDCLGRQKSS